MIQDSTITEQAVSRLDQVASQLGVAVEYLWPAAVAHTQAQGITGIIFVVVSVVYLWWALPRIPKLITPKTTEAEGVFGFILAMAAIAFFITLLVGLNGIPNLIAPEGATIKALLP